MKCIYCNSPLAAIDYCPGCGADVTLQKRIGRVSNLLYNRGLEKASVRDLSGAESCLRRSLKFNKENIAARNLLGLCYFETGEVVLALCEWVISKNMVPENNPASGYIDQLQNNKNQLDVINQSIRKYNQSIEYCRNDQEDMAIMQLRKVVSQNPKLVKAKQLLALLYMKYQDYEKARRLLKKAAAIDNTNTTTLRYLTEIEEITGRGTTIASRSLGRRTGRAQEEIEESGAPLHYMSGNETIIQPTTFRDSSTVATFINIGLGALLGGAIIWFMAVPATRQSILQTANEQVTDANLQLASGTAQIQDLQDQITSLESKVENANLERDDALAKAESYDALMAAAVQYVGGEITAASDAVADIDESKLDGTAKVLYESLMGGVSGTLFDGYYSAGTTAYVSRDYATAASQLQKAVEADKDGTNVNYYNALYYLAFAYYNQGDTSNANKYFNEIVTKFPAQAASVQPYITSSGGATNSQGEAAMNSNAQQGTADQNAQNGQSTQTGQNGNTQTPSSTDQSTAANTSGSTDTTWTDQSGQQADQSAGTWTDQSGQITVYDDGSGYSNQTGTGYDPSQVAWTDPNTGLNYDAYGNLLG